MKKLTFVCAIALMSFTSAALAANPKTDAKSDAPAKTEAKTNLVWYPVTYDAAHMSGYIPAGTSIAVTGDKADAEDASDCPEGSNRDCLRGFQSAPTLPSSSVGDDQTKRD